MGAGGTHLMMRNPWRRRGQIVYAHVAIVRTIVLGVAVRRRGIRSGWRSPAETVVRNVMLIANWGTGGDRWAGDHHRWRCCTAASTRAVSDRRGITRNANSELLEGWDHRWWFLLEYYVSWRGYTIASGAGRSWRRWRALGRLDLVRTAAWDPGSLRVAGTAATATSHSPKIVLLLLLLLLLLMMLLLLLAAFRSAILEPNLEEISRGTEKDVTWHSELMRKKCYSQTQHCNICHPLLHVSVQLANIKHHVTKFLKI